MATCPVRPHDLDNWTGWPVEEIGTMLFLFAMVQTRNWTMIDVIAVFVLVRIGASCFLDHVCGVLEAGTGIPSSVWLQIIDMSVIKILIGIMIFLTVWVIKKVLCFAGLVTYPSQLLTSSTRRAVGGTRRAQLQYSRPTVTVTGKRSQAAYCCYGWIALLDSLWRPLQNVGYNRFTDTSVRKENRRIRRRSKRNPLLIIG